MQPSFSQNLLNLRKQSGLTQQQLADKLFVERSTLASWETGRRVPDAILLQRIADFFKVETRDLINIPHTQTVTPNVIMVDDEGIILSGEIRLLKSVLPNTNIKGFKRTSEALDYAKSNKVDLALLDIEIGKFSGLDLCKKLLKLNPKTNVIFLTAYTDYAFDAWTTGASGFMLKPLTEDAVRKELRRLRYPIKGLEAV